METTIRLSHNTDKMLLIVATTLTLLYYIALSSTHFHATSKIEEGTIVVKNDSITTVIIPDKR